MSFKPTPDETFAMPLASLEAVLLDTETTGLDVKKDRVIEFGAIKLHPGPKRSDDTFSSFVDPGINIPEHSTEIHHITNKMVKGADPFKTVMKDFTKWSGPAVIMGYSIGFDIAIMQSEHERHNIAWSAPKTLDVRHLCQIVAPNLPEQSLELSAEWLGIDIVDRHRALADAVLTRQVFEGLIPLLAEKGIVTLAQARQACQKLTSSLTTEAQAGWHQIDSPLEVKSSFAEYARIDSFPYRHHVSELMSQNPIVVPGTMKLKEALAQMLDQDASAIYVKVKKNTDEYGILTEKDFLTTLSQKGINSLNVKVMDVAKKPLITIQESEMIYRAMTKVATKGFRHLGVVNRKGELVGSLSLRELLYQRADEALSLGENIGQSKTPGELGKIWGSLTTVARTLWLEEVDARNIAEIISKELRALTRRSCELAEEQMKTEKHGKPPCDFSVMVLGSGGRGESLLAMDQDNALITERALKTAKEKKWFELFGKKVADILNEAGVPYCTGHIMTSNPEWRGSIKEWEKRVKGWISRSKPEDILKCDIFFDSRPVYGDYDIANNLHSYALKIAGNASDFLNLLAQNANDFSVPLGVFGRFKLTDGRIDLKMGGIMPIFSAARVLALKNGVTERSTPERLAQAALKDTLLAKTDENLIEAHRILLNLILSQQLKDIANGAPLSNKVDPKQLSSFEEDELKWALDQLPSISSVLKIPTTI